MRDLKDLLEPLGDRPMPDRWDSIQRRPVGPLPEPHRSRVGAGIAAAAIAVLAVAVIAWLSPLGGPGDEPAASAGGAAPSWLVDQAYQLAYENGDVAPDEAEWVLTDANTIAPAVGLQSGDPNVQEYLVVLHGDFTGYEASVPTGTNLPSGHVLSAAFDANSQAPTDWGISDDAPAVAGSTPFDLPDASQVFVSPEGWTMPVPPGWHTRATTVPAPRGPAQGTIITNGAAASTTPSGTDTAVAAANFPAAGVAMVVSDLPPDGQTQPVVPPLHWSDFTQEVSNDQGSTAWRVSLQGPRQIFSMEARVGNEASPQDVAALHDMIASLVFGDEAGTLPSPSGPPGLPTQSSAVDDRFVTDVVLDDGAFSVQPAPIGTVPVVSKADAEKILYASPLFQGKSAGVLGFGLITSQVSQHGVPTYESDPGWIAFGWGGVSNCPNETVPPSPADLPSDGYAAVALIEGAGGGDISYEARSDACGTITGPTVRPATHIESVPWTSNGQVTGGSLQVTYTPPPCAGSATYSAGGSGDTSTLSVQVEVPDTRGSCSGPAPITDVVPLNDGTQTTATVHHAPTGFVRQAGF